MTPKLIQRTANAKLESRASLKATGDDLAGIAKQVPDGWPAPTEADVYVASALVCNDLVDHYSTRFTESALAEIASLIVGTNVMRNHVDYGSDALPVGRCFAAELVRQSDGLYVRAYFYWERSTTFGDEMAKKIALGIWREVSLRWWMRSFTNSVDGLPLDESPYYPGQMLPDGSVVVGIMSDIVSVEEFSIVYLGGQKNTSMNPARSGEDVLEMVSDARTRRSAPVDPWRRWFSAA